MALYNQPLGYLKMLIEERGSLAYIISERLDKSSRLVSQVKFDLQKGQEIYRKDLPITSDLRYFEFKNVFLSQDQGLIFTFERTSLDSYADVKMVSGTGVTTTASTTPKDYYSDLFVFKVIDGLLVWKTYIKKHQVFVSVNNLSRYASFRTHLGNNNKCYIFFNDNIENYNLLNEYILKKGKNLKDFKLYSEKIKVIKKYGVAMTEIDLETGQAKRQLITRQSGIVQFSDPKSFDNTPKGVTFTLKSGEKTQIAEVILN